MQGLRTLGHPYSDSDIAKARELTSVTEMQALIAYLQGLGKYAPKREADPLLQTGSDAKVAEGDAPVAAEVKS
jgi:cbb3-type cytochrome oxidase cytochrome c subunit